MSPFKTFLQGGGQKRVKKQDLMGRELYCVESQCCGTLWHIWLLVSGAFIFGAL